MADRSSASDLFKGSSSDVTQNTRVFVAGHRGMVGAAIVRQLESENQVEIHTRSRQELDLRDSCLLYTSPSPRDRTRSRMPSSA